MKIRISFSLILLLFTAHALDAQARRGTFVLTNARIETITGGTIEHGTLLGTNWR
jgi:hypothetical protein